MTMPHAVIIAGGKGQRLGTVCKADLRVGGRRLVDRVAEALGEVQSLMISVGPVDSGRGARRGALPVTDAASPVGGPLAGLAAAVKALQAQGITEGLLVSVAVDTPFLPPDFVARLRDGLGDAAVAYAEWGGQFYPPNAIWRLEAIAELPQQVMENRAPHSLKALQRDLGAVAVDWSHHAIANPFANLNTIADLLTLGRLA